MGKFCIGEDVYKTLEEKAANLLYFVTKNHSFSDGNKRIAATTFLYFLDKNESLIIENEKIIDDYTLVALTIMIAESRPEEKDYRFMLGGMKVSRGIIVFGANGSGKTTLGCELAQALKFKHIDVEDYYFKKSDIFYENPRTKDDVIHLMLTDIKMHGSFVFSGVTGNYGESIISMYKLAVLLSAPIDLRMERIRNRAIDKHGERALPNGDVYENREKFIEYARTRDLSVIDQWASTLTCPVIHLDATMPISHNTRKIIDVYCAL